MIAVITLGHGEARAQSGDGVQAQGPLTAIERAPLPPLSAPVVGPLQRLSGSDAPAGVVRPPGLIPVPQGALPAPDAPLPPQAPVDRRAAGIGSGQMIAAPALAPIAPSPVGPPPTGAFKSIREAFSAGIRGYNAGDKASAVQALQFAAGQGHVVAQWKLGRMHADGDGVPHDDLKAFEYFSGIADAFADESPDSPHARFVSNAFVAVGSYFLDGIPNTYVRVNAVRARDMFRHAATYFGDADAQYNFARMLIEGQGGPREPRPAVRWLSLAAEKNHHAAQGLLGHILFTGQGVSRQPARGLMLLTLARDGANGPRDLWIAEAQDKAFAAATESERQNALAMLERWVAGRRD